MATSEAATSNDTRTVTERRISALSQMWRSGATSRAAGGEPLRLRQARDECLGAAAQIVVRPRDRRYRY
jgi:hypothetical protein